SGLVAVSGEVAHQLPGNGVAVRRGRQIAQAGEGSVLAAESDHGPLHHTLRAVRRRSRRCDRRVSRGAAGSKERSNGGPAPLKVLLPQGARFSASEASACTFRGRQTRSRRAARKTVFRQTEPAGTGARKRTEQE